MAGNFSKILYLARQSELHHLQRSSRTPTLCCACNDFQPLLAPKHSLRRSPSRSFATSSSWRAEAVAKESKSKEKKNHTDPTMARAMERAKRQGLVTEDIGLVQDTFVMPIGKAKPNWISNFRGRLLLERKRLRTRAMETLQVLFYKLFWARPRPKLNRSKIPKVAEDLHRSMYEHFAAGDLRQVESSVMSGMLSSLRGRIAQRTPGTQLKWKLHKYLTPSKLVSYKAHAMEGPRKQKTDRRGLIQAVVRIHSLQSLQHIRKAHGKNKREILVDAQGRELSGVENSEDGAMRHAKEVFEYVVVQKMSKGGRETPWKLWGFTEATTVAKIEQKQKESKVKRATAPAAA